MTTIDPAKVMAEHAQHHVDPLTVCCGCSDPGPYFPHCLPYRLAEVLAAEQAKVQRLRDVHARYFDMDGKPGLDDTDPEPEDVWRYDRDFRAALDGPR